MIYVTKVITSVGIKKSTLVYFKNKFSIISTEPNAFKVQYMNSSSHEHGKP